MLNKIHPRYLDDLDFCIFGDGTFNHGGRVAQKQDNELVILSNGTTNLGDRYNNCNILPLAFRVIEIPILIALNKIKRKNGGLISAKQYIKSNEKITDIIKYIDLQHTREINENFNCFF